MEEVIKKINEIFDQFAKEELGNRYSQFAHLALKSLISEEVKKLKITKKDE
jgi:hypothetical protein